MIVEFARQVLVIRQIPVCGGLVRAPRMGTVDRGIDGHFPVAQPCRIGTPRQGGQNLIPAYVQAVAAVALPNRLPRAKMRLQILPANPGLKPGNDALNREWSWSGWPAFLKEPVINAAMSPQQ